MTRTLYISIIFLFSISFLSCDDQGSLKKEQNQVFIKLYGGIKSEQGLGFVLLPDGGFVLVGSTSSVSSGQDDVDVYVVRTDSAGNELWYLNFGRDGDDMASAVVLGRSDNSIIVCGESEESQSSFRDIFVAEVDLNGNLINQNYFGETGRDEYGTDVIHSVGSGYLAVGNVKENSRDTSIYFIETDLSLAPISNGERDNIGYTGLENSISQVLILNDSNYLAIGTTSNGLPLNEGSRNIFLFRSPYLNNAIIPDGFFYGNSDDQYGTSIAETGGGYILAGYSDLNSTSVPYIININRNFNTIWEKNDYNFEGRNEPQSIIQSSDGGFVFTSISNKPNLGSELGLVKLGVSGEDIIWERNIGSEGNDFGKQVIQLDNNFFVAIGSFDFDINNQNLSKMGLVRTNPLGELIPLE